MRVLQLWRYPVKSMAGEQLSRVAVGELGVEGDRQWALVDPRTGRVVTAKREPSLLFATARLGDGESVEITLPDGRLAGSDAELSAWLGREVVLTRASSTSEGELELPRDYEHESDWVTWPAPSEVWHDAKHLRVSMVSTATIGSWDVRRFRPNVLLDGAGEDGLVGESVRLGSAALTIVAKIPRCVVVTRAQPGIDRDLSLLRTINRDRATFLAVGGEVTGAGTVSLGDRLETVPSAGEVRDALS